MAIENADLAFYKGEDVEITHKMTPEEDTTGWTIVFSARSVAAGTGGAEISASASAVDASRGINKFAIADTDTDALTAGIFEYDVKRTDAGEETVLTRGKLNLKQDVTH
ncbi:hypothetical protein LCGC14_2230200 [marine sediment metagenome]|uniref:BppU N-terminal domain-containing protein n=1 Tax=marine sediment metagenome TaxID=412755 RepID=A0A0F9D8Q2_9ZZZZ